MGLAPPEAAHAHRAPAVQEQLGRLEIGLDREIVLVVNGRARTVKATRDLQTLARTASDMQGTGEVYTVRLGVNA